MIEFELLDKNGMYNSPMEFGMRALFIMSVANGQLFDLQKLIYLDYLTVHSDDIDEGPIGLHTKVPYRGCEILVKRNMLEKGLMLFVGKELIDVVFDENGISYKASELGLRFIDLFESKYAGQLKQICYWLKDQFVGKTTSELEEFVNKNLYVWGGENKLDSIIRKGIIN